MTVALVYPPTCDPTAPYLAVPMLTGYLRAHGVGVLPIDANLEAYDELLAPEPLGRLARRLETRLDELDGRTALGHAEQLEYASLWRARGDARAVPGHILEAKATLRDPSRFYDYDAYGPAVATIDGALRLVSAAHHPLHLDFTAYRTPFGLLSMAEIERGAAPDANPFHAYVEETLIPRLRAAAPSIVGLSVCFPGQLQPAYAFGLALKRALPDTHLTFGGPGVTQLLIRLKGQRLAKALGPFDSAVVFEGESTLLELARAVAAGSDLRRLTNLVLRDPLLGARYLSGHGMEDLKALPAPDFDGLPLDRYFAPRLVLPYDPTRGCYWGKCTFCHYGLAEVGTAKYRERAVDTATAHLRALSERHGTKHFYFSQDSVAPKTLLKLARELTASGLGLRWATDLKPEKYLTEERARELREGGAVACALGVESAAPRVLELIDKGAPIEVVGDVVDRLSASGIAAEAMCFTDFPTESVDEARETLRFLDERRDRIAVYIVGEFGLTHGSLVAQRPSDFGITDVWQVEGDELGLGLFFEPEAPWKTPEEARAVNEELAELSRGWALRPYPWAGAVSTAHTILYYDRFGPGVFRTLPSGTGVPLGATKQQALARFDVLRAAEATSADASLWQTLVTTERRVSREAYEAAASALPAMAPSPRVYRFTAGEDPAPVGGPRFVLGRRPSHATSALRR